MRKTFACESIYLFKKNNQIKPTHEVIIAGSSNLTFAGRQTLNLTLENMAKKLFQRKKWFDNLWDEAVPFDLASYFEEIFQVKTPFEIFLKGVMGVIRTRN